MPRRTPRNPEPYRSAFRAQVHFNQEIAALVFPATSLKQPLPSADPIMHQKLQQHILEADGSVLTTQWTSLRRQLCKKLLKGNCSATTMARRLSMHRRTLNRRLKSEGTAFQAIADEMRSALARHMLADTELPLAHIAAALDFSDPLLSHMRSGAGQAECRRVSGAARHSAAATDLRIEGSPSDVRSFPHWFAWSPMAERVRAASTS